MPIITSRLVLRPADPAYAQAMHEAKIETWDMLSRWMPWAEKPGSPEEDEQVLEQARDKFESKEDMMLCAFEKDSERFIGATGLHRFDWRIRRFEIGYWVRKSAQGKGYATEIAGALTRYAFNALEARAVSIDAAVGNDKSIAVIEKLGFEKEGILRQHMHLPTGEISDHVYYSRLSPEGLPDLDVSWGA